MEWPGWSIVGSCETEQCMYMIKTKMMKGSLGGQFDYAQEVYLADISIGCSNPPSSACNQNIGNLRQSSSL